MMEVRRGYGGAARSQKERTLGAHVWHAGDPTRRGSAKAVRVCR